MARLHADGRSPIRLENRVVATAELIASLSFALDLTEGACPGHAVRSCILGMRIAKEMGLSSELSGDLYYALLLKDVGCSSNATRLFQIVGDDEIRAKRLTKETDWTRFQWSQMKYLLKHAHSHENLPGRVRGIKSMLQKSSENAEMLIRLRCEKGARVVRDLGMSQMTAGAIYCLDEHWNGMGYPDRLQGEDIPLLARIASVAQTLEVFYRLHGKAAAMDVLQKRSGRWFDPAIVRAVTLMLQREVLWQGLADEEIHEEVARLEPMDKKLPADAFTIDGICVAFAEVVDAKSHYTFTHSSGVAKAAVKIGECLNLSPRELTTLRRAGLLHDIGKLSVPNSILDKRGSLTAEEWTCVQQHPRFTYEILSRVQGFAEIATVAAQHHERLDGSGYFAGLKGDDLCLPSRILTVADIFDALSGERPYRERMDLDRILGIVKRQAPHALDPGCVSALESFAEEYPVAAPAERQTG